jgi:hypothetical protein
MQLNESATELLDAQSSRDRAAAWEMMLMEARAPRTEAEKRRFVSRSATAEEWLKKLHN